MLGDVLREVLSSSCFSPRYSRALFGLDRVDALALASKECEWPSRSLFQKASDTACANNKTVWENHRENGGLMGFNGI